MFLRPAQSLGLYLVMIRYRAKIKIRTDRDNRETQTEIWGKLYHSVSTCTKCRTQGLLFYLQLFDPYAPFLYLCIKAFEGG